MTRYKTAQIELNSQNRCQVQRIRRAMKTLPLDNGFEFLELIKVWGKRSVLRPISVILTVLASAERMKIPMSCCANTFRNNGLQQGLSQPAQKTVEQLNDRPGNGSVIAHRQSVLG